MEDKHLVEPDLAFIDAVMKNGGESLKKCFQCATCSVACKLSSDQQPFPRKEMLYAAWGLKGRLVGDPDIWLCHNCGDCSDLCPRGAKPGDTLGAIRRFTIKWYARPSIFSRLFDGPNKIPLLMVIPALIILAVGYATGWLNLSHAGGPIVYAHFFAVPLIESIFIPLSIGVGLVFFFGIKQMLSDMQTNYFERGLTDGSPISPVSFLKTLIKTFPSILSLPCHTANWPILYIEPSPSHTVLMPDGIRRIKGVDIGITDPHCERRHFAGAVRRSTHPTAKKRCHGTRTGNLFRLYLTLVLLHYRAY